MIVTTLSRSGFGQLISFASVLASISAFGCTLDYAPRSDSQTPTTVNSKCEILKVDEKPSGNELDIRAEQVRGNEFLIRVKNVSNRSVFLAYEPGEKDLPHFLSFMTQKRMRNGDFVTVSEGGDSSPGLNPLLAGEETLFLFLDIEKGDYKLEFSYLVDEKLVRILNDPDCSFNLSKADKVHIGEANVTVFTPVLHISKSVPKSKP